MYHDLGNMNCTFFTRKSAYDRRRNLDIVCKAIQSLSSSINVRVNERDDIVVNQGFNPKSDKKVRIVGMILESNLYFIFIIYHNFSSLQSRTRLLGVWNCCQIRSEVSISSLYCSG